MSVAFEFEPLLIETVIESRMRSATDRMAKRLEKDYRRHAEDIYSASADETDRETGFRSVYKTLFKKLDYPGFFAESLEPFPLLTRRLDKIVVFNARHKRDEGADLPAAGPEKAASVRAALHIMPQRFADDTALDTFLKFNWLQLQDLLDPAFGYTGDAVFQGRHPAEVQQLANVYSLLWALYASHRMHLNGWPVDDGYAAHVDAIEQLVGSELAPQFQPWLSDRKPVSHARLAELAVKFQEKRRNTASGVVARCDLCRFPATNLTVIDGLSDGGLLRALGTFYPKARGAVCPHCRERLEIMIETLEAGKRVGHSQAENSLG